MSIGCGVVVSSWPNDSDRVDKVVRVFEVFMIRTLTILILSITQVLSGLGCGGYLCFHKDGTFCGVDGGAENCSCCDESAESADACQGHQCCHEKLDHKCCAIAGNLSRAADEPFRSAILSECRRHSGFTALQLHSHSDQRTSCKG
jgi:hypothetical protein